VPRAENEQNRADKIAAEIDGVPIQILAFKPVSSSCRVVKR